MANDVISSIHKFAKSCRDCSVDLDLVIETLVRFFLENELLMSLGTVSNRMDAI